jgi:hypothetical protein
MSRVTVKTVSIIIHERIEKTRCTEHFFPVPNCARQRNKKARVKCRGAEAIETLNYGFINCSLTKPQVAGENR